MDKPRLPQPETINIYQKRDLFQTPNYAIDLLVPFIPKDITFIWECASGEGKISQRLSEYNYSICPSDIRNIHMTHNTNFITDDPPYPISQAQFIGRKFAIITNPPFSLKRKFFKKCIEYDVPFALLISGDYSLWTIEAIEKYGCEKIVPTRRIDYITPTGKSGATGNKSYFHSYWMTRYFDLGQSETFVTLTNKMKENI